MSQEEAWVLIFLRSSLDHSDVWSGMEISLSKGEKKRPVIWHLLKDIIYPVTWNHFSKSWKHELCLEKGKKHFKN